MREESSVARAVGQAWSRLGGIDMLVNNAGIGMRTVNPRFMTDPQGFWEVPPGGFRAVIETNLTGYFLVAREVTPRMLAAGGGRIVNISVSHRPCTGPGSSPTGRPGPAARRCRRSWPPTCGTPPSPSTCCCPAARPSPACCRPAPWPAGQAFLEPAVMGPPIVWLASDEAAGVHDERIVAADFERWLRDKKGRR